MQALPPSSSREGVSSTQGTHAPATLETVYAECARFVWLTLQRLGVRRADLDDVCHDVFVVVQRKLPEFDPSTKVQSWLFGICLRTAANYRRLAHIRLEHSVGGGHDIPALAHDSGHPDNEFARREALAHAETILERMTPMMRAVFVMFELEGMSCQGIADELSVPIGTVYSRLHAARKAFVLAAERQDKRSRGANG